MAIQLRIYTESVDGTVTANKARSAVARLNDLYGKYPWPDLVLAEVGADDGFSMEYPRAIHLTRSKVADSYVVNHEVAHQWFYAQLGNDQMREPWLDEGFADFTRALADGHRREPVLRAARSTARSSPGRRDAPPAATGRAATATSTPSSTRAPSS